MLVSDRQDAGLVRAIISLGAPLDVALPGVVGLLSARFGLLAGLALLGAAPILILLALIGYKTPPTRKIHITA